MADETPLTGNALEELRAVIAARVAGAPEEGPQVLCIRTRQAWMGKPKVTRQRKPKKPPVCLNSMDTLTDAIAQVKAGDLVGTMIIGRRRNGSFYIGVTLPHGGDVQQDAGAYVLGTEILKRTLMEINEYGLEATEEAYDLENEDEPS